MTGGVLTRLVYNKARRVTLLCVTAPYSTAVTVNRYVVSFELLIQSDRVNLNTVYCSIQYTAL